MERKVVAKKKFGQNFLKDENVLNKIIQSIPNSDEKIVEIGAGLGDLTQRLLELRDVLSYEIDNDLCELLKKRFSKEIDRGRLTLLCKDVLECRGSFFEGGYILVANLPYYIATAIILRALQDINCKAILVMVQKEVAKKFCANPGDRDYGAISVIAELSGKRELLFDVMPNSFDPPPKVTSSLFLIQKERSLDDKVFFGFLKSAFNSPRKKLSANLSAQVPKEEVERYFLDKGINPNIRPHEFSASEYLSLFKKFKKGREDGTYRE